MLKVSEWLAKGVKVEVSWIEVSWTIQCLQEEAALLIGRQICLHDPDTHLHKRFSQRERSFLLQEDSASEIENVFFEHLRAGQGKVCHLNQD